MPHSITIRHNAEMGHRLPHLGGKCQSLHGHSFWIEVTIESRTLNTGIVAEYAEAKAWLRGWIDREWDHGIVLGDDDPLTSILPEFGKVTVYPFPPTVENLAQCVGQETDLWCRRRNTFGAHHAIYCATVTVQETHVNAATWTNHNLPILRGSVNP